MKALSALNKYFNTDEDPRVPKKKIGDFKAEVDELSMADRNELGKLAAAELGEPFEASSE